VLHYNQVCIFSCFQDTRPQHMLMNNTHTNEWTHTHQQAWRTAIPPDKGRYFWLLHHEHVFLLLAFHIHCLIHLVYVCCSEMTKQSLVDFRITVVELEKKMDALYNESKLSTLEYTYHINNLNRSWFANAFWVLFVRCILIIIIRRKNNK